MKTVNCNGKHCGKEAFAYEQHGFVTHALSLCGTTGHGGFHHLSRVYITRVYNPTLSNEVYDSPFHTMMVFI